jgi:hypothetical protein
MCRNKFELFVKACFRNLFKRRNWRQARDLIVQTFRPQIFELRRDLVQFLLSGTSLKYERSRKKNPTGFKGHFWRWVCWLGFYLGVPLRIILRSRAS